MGTLYLAGNETLQFGGHLQFVYEQNGQFFELEIQGSLNPDADWNYISANLDEPRPHFGQNTPGTNSEGMFDAAVYGRVEMVTGDVADRLWANLQAINNSLATHAATMDYDTIGADCQRRSKIAPISGVIMHHGFW